MTIEIEQPKEDEKSYLAEIRARHQSSPEEKYDALKPEWLMIRVEYIYAGDKVRQLMHYDDLLDMQKTIADVYKDSLKKPSETAEEIARLLAKTVEYDYKRRGHRDLKITVSAKNHEFELN